MRYRKDLGQALPFMAMAMVAVMAFVGLAIDVGYLFFQQRLEQTAADAGAVAAAKEMFTSKTVSSLANAADNATAANGYTNNANGVTVTVNYPPSAVPNDPYNGNTNAVEVIVNKPQPTFFMRVLGFGNVPVATRAVGLLSSSGTGCIYLLSPTNSNFKNGASINAPNCVLYFNGPTKFNGGTVTAQGIGYYSASGFTSNGTNYTNGSPIATGLAPDPCTSGQIPGCAQMASLTPSTTCTAVTLTGQTINPGCYTNMTVTSGGTLNPGLYFITGSLSVKSNSAPFVGSGVTLDFTGSGSLSFAKGTTINLAACTTTLTPNITCQQGAVDNILIYGPNMSIDNLSGGGQTLTGVVYAPNAQNVTLNGNGGGRTYSVFILGSVTVNGNNVTVTATGPPSGTQSYILVPVLGE